VRRLRCFPHRQGQSCRGDAYLTGDVKYHEFFDADSKLLLADIGHYGSEQFTMNLIQRRLGNFSLLLPSV
jgi:putative NIF3 family GTP cyclohydrolase 1 type 2